MDIPDRYLDTLQSILPDLEVASLELNREGMVNDVLIVNGELALRFPKSDKARDALEREARILDIVCDRVALPVPRLDHHSEKVASYPLIPGVPLTRDRIHSLDSADRYAVLGQLGGFLRDLHAIDPVAATDLPASDAVRTRDDWLSFLARVEEVLFPLLFRYQRDWVTSHFAPVVSGELQLDYEPVLVHGDLAPYHILFDPAASRISGVIDFGTAGLGDPAIDVACLIYQYGESTVRKLARHYPSLGACIDRARFWAGTLELQWALAGLVNDDRSLLVAHIGSARDVGLPGNRVT